jgi:hypothetical protein
VIVDDVGHTFDIKTSSSYIGAHKDIVDAILK